MTERRSERWLVTSGAASVPVRTRDGADDTVIEVEVGSGDDARVITATVLSCSDDTCVVSIAGRSRVVRLAPQDRGHQAMVGGDSFAVTAAVETGADSRDENGPDAGATSAGADLDALCAPMPATVSAILAQPGAVVQAGDVLLRLEAMKMELAIRAPAAGRVATVHCRAGDLVQPGRPLVGLDPHPAPPLDDPSDG